MIEPKTFEERIKSLHEERRAIEATIKDITLENYEDTRLERTRRAYDILKNDGVKISKPSWMVE